jgi:small-conductance mechanosensitive channel
MPWETEFWTENLNRLLADLLLWLPALGAALALLVGGWVVARLVQALLGGLLRRVGLDRLAESAGAAKVLRDLGLESEVSRLLARFVYWLILLVFVLAAADTLKMHQVTDTLRLLVAYLPRVLAAILIVLFGSLVARLVGNGVGAMADRSGVRGGMAMGQVVRTIILIFVTVLAIEQLGVETTLLVATATALVAAVALALAVAFGWGSRELARNIMAGFHAREEFAVGQRLAVRGHSGRLVGIGTIRTQLETEAGLVSLPNSALTEEEVVLLSEKGDRT